MSFQRLTVDREKEVKLYVRRQFYPSRVMFDTILMLYENCRIVKKVQDVYNFDESSADLESSSPGLGVSGYNSQSSQPISEELELSLPTSVSSQR